MAFSAFQERLRQLFRRAKFDGGVVSTSTPVVEVVQTWNNAGATFVGKTTNITDTASASGSLIEDWNVGGVSKASLTKTGGFVCRIGEGLTSRNGATLYPDTSIQVRGHTNEINIFSNSSSSTAPAIQLTGSTAIIRGTVEIRADTNAQTSRLYGTYTDASNYRRLAYTMSTAGVAEIKPEGAGAGVFGNVLHISGLPTSNPGAGILWNDGGTVKVGTAWSPLAQQIAAMSPSLWLEPSLTNYQDSAGTTLVTQPGGGAADPPVGLALDLSGNGRNASQSTSTARPKLSARVNQLTESEAISSSPWVAYNSGNGSVLSAITAPDGTVTAIGLNETSGSGYYGMTQNQNINTGATSTFSCYVKQGTNTTGFSVWLIGSGSNLYFQNTISWTAGVPTASGWSAVSVGNGWYRISFPFAAGASTSVAIYLLPCSTISSETGSTYFWGAQLNLGSTATAYQRVIDANNYDYTGWPLIHQFDGVDDVLNVTFPSSLGSDCTVVTANRGTTPTILTGQTIGTSYTITATNAGRLVFPRALTADETAIVTAWATQKGALPS